MAINFIKRLSAGTIPYFALAGLLFVLAYLLSVASEDSSRLNDLFLFILGLTGFSLILLMGLLIRSLYHLYRDFKNKREGSRLTIRLVSLFVLLLLVSTTIVYSFSMHFLHRGMNSWFDVKVEQALSDSLELSRTAFGIRMRTLLKQTRLMTGVLHNTAEDDLNRNLRELSKLSGSLDLSLWTIKGELITASIENPILLPDRPDASILRQLEGGQDYIGIDPGEDKLQLRAAALLPDDGLSDRRFLQVIYPVNVQLSVLGKTVQEAYTDYKELVYLRKPLITIFTISLSLIVLLTLLASIWFAIWISRRIVEPLQELSEGTQAVAAGNYNTQLSAFGHDEIGFLVRSFNQMTQGLTQARDGNRKSHRLLEQQTRYLSTVLGSLSSGVITVDKRYYLRTANIASSRILAVDLQKRLESKINKLSDDMADLHVFVLLVEQQMRKKTPWKQQVEIHQKGIKTLMCQGTPLPNNAGWVIVFDDITTLLQAQRNAAWGEVAKRLAHEIKNPLTPIQLSAERLQHKYLPLVPADQSETLTKLTQTIVQQVDAMKEMVNDFSDYARNPGLQLQSSDIGTLLQEVLDLYQSNQQHKIHLQGQSASIQVMIDKNRFRQVLHNLMKNAIEACEESGCDVDIVVSYQQVEQNGYHYLEIRIADHGPGVAEDMLAQLFEPYATSKIKGTGLGLAIVKKIIEEHQGHVWAENTGLEGACIIIQLPLGGAIK